MLHIPLISDGPEIVLDGRMDEPQWQQAMQVPIRYLTAPIDEGEADVYTMGYLFEDGKTLYVAFEAHDPNPEQIRAAYRNRDQIWGDDVIGLKLDTYGNQQLAYQFFSNPLGSQADSIENAVTGRESSAWDGHWEAFGRITEQGYRVEMAIPLHILNIPTTEGPKSMAFELVRFLPRDQQLRISSAPIKRSNRCMVCQMTPVTGFATAEHSRSLVVAPALVTGIEQRRAPAPNEDWRSENNTDVSLDVKWGITPDMTLNATLNPDFSQVEADTAELSINNPFTLFFAEKRPFFTENADYFATPWNLVHTRNIAEPNAGAKFTGRLAQHTFGIFSTDDQQTTLLIPGNLGSRVTQLPGSSQNHALSYSYAANADLTFGSLLTQRSASDYRNTVVSADSNWRISPHDTLTVQWVATETEYPELLAAQLSHEAALRVQADKPLRGQGYRLNYLHQQRNWHAYVRYQHRNEDFRADLGFMPETDWQELAIGGDYTWFFNNPQRFHRFRLLNHVFMTENAAGEFLSKEIESYAVLSGQMNSTLELGSFLRQRVGNRQDQSLLTIAGNTERYNEQGLHFFGEIRPRRDLSMYLYWQEAEVLDLTNERLSDQQRIIANVRYSANQHLDIRWRHTHTDMRYQAAQVFTADLTDLRLTWQFNNRSFMRLALIYTQVDRNLSNYEDSWQSMLSGRQRNLTSQLLYSYQLNPQTVFFIGYGDNASADDKHNELKRDQRSAFLKFSYAWLL
ncbi:MAG: carbohydrate binding family 9 domain-containing protein [Alkalimonas sp.]|nr:carbohydrate binding family 9 domain-containing protein [Alkalimonas sp.]